MKSGFSWYQAFILSGVFWMVVGLYKVAHVLQDILQELKEGINLLISPPV